MGKYLIISLFIIVPVLFFSAEKAYAHCDTLDGPVVNAARRAMKTENVNYILIWVSPKKEDEIRKAFRKAQNKKKFAKTQQEKDEAEMELFETLVRIHREGEGAKYEGITPAGSIEPEIALADKAVETKKLDDVLGQIKSPENKEIILHLFHRVMEKYDYNPDDVAAGREFIESYVVFIHAVEKAMKGVDLDKSKLHDH